MTFDFTSTSAVFNTHEDDEFVTIKDCVQCNPVYD